MKPPRFYLQPADSRLNPLMSVNVLVSLGQSRLSGQEVVSQPQTTVQDRVPTSVRVNHWMLLRRHGDCVCGDRTRFYHVFLTRTRT